MKVFISWSGDLSEKLGEAVRDWLPSALQVVQPYFTPRDVDKGARWASAIANELEASSVGILCLTPDNLAAPWLLFEAGAISRVVSESHVCPVLFGVAPGNVSGPLSQFQMTEFNRAEFFKLFCTINRLAGEKALGDTNRDHAFEMCWPQLEATVQALIKAHAHGAAASPRSDRDMVEETLMLARSTAKELRFVQEMLMLLGLQDQPGSSREDLPFRYIRRNSGLSAIGRARDFVDDSHRREIIRTLWEALQRSSQEKEPDDEGSSDPGAAGAS